MLEGKIEEAVRASGINTSTTLLEMVKQRDEIAWKNLTELYGPLVYHWCRRSGLSSEDSADLLQDVYRALLLNIDNFTKSTERGSFRAWLWTITRNRIADFFRAKSSKAQAAGGSEMLRQLHDLPELEPDEHADSGISNSSSLTSRALSIIKSEVKPKP